MRHFPFYLTLLAALAVCHPATARSPTVAEIRTYLSASGGHETLNRYFDDSDSDHDGGLRLIESGNKDAVALAIDMLAYSDAHSSESLLASLGTAMMHNPRAVLPLLNSDKAGLGLLDAAHICAPFIGDDVGNAKALAILARTRRAIAAVQDRGLRMPRDACLADIARAEDTIRGSHPAR